MADIKFATYLHLIAEGTADESVLPQVEATIAETKQKFLKHAIGATLQACLGAAKNGNFGVAVKPCYGVTAHYYREKFGLNYITGSAQMSW